MSTREQRETTKRLRIGLRASCVQLPDNDFIHKTFYAFPVYAILSSYSQCSFIREKCCFLIVRTCSILFNEIFFSGFWITASLTYI